MVDVAQLVEPRIVIPAVAGSSPVVHPTFLIAMPCPGADSRHPDGGALARPDICHRDGYTAPPGLGPLAQLVEQLTLNQLVVGSIPTRPTIQ